jgi:hypothetical protein
LLPVGITFTCVGAVAAIAGALFAASASEEGDRFCGNVVGGCVTRVDRGRELAAGALVGGGLTMTAVAVPTLAVGSGRVPREGYRVSHGMTAGGAVLVQLGAGVFGGGIGTIVGDGARGDVDAVFAPGIVAGVGAALVAVGATLWGLGARRVEPPPDKAAQRGGGEAAP